MLKPTPFAELKSQAEAATEKFAAIANTFQRELGAAQSKAYADAQALLLAFSGQLHAEYAAVRKTLSGN